MKFTDAEEAIMVKIADVWNEWCKLPVQHPSDLDEVQTAIHELQKTMGLRILRREMPDYWYSQGNGET